MTSSKHRPRHSFSTPYDDVFARFEVRAKLVRQRIANANDVDSAVGKHRAAR